jgi:hypothetical protein
MPHKAWLQSFSDMVGLLPENQVPSQQLLADIRLVLDEAIVIAINHGARLPNFVMEPGRLEAIERRLGQARIAELVAQHAPHHAVEDLIPLITKLAIQFDAIERRSAETNWDREMQRDQETPS